MGDAVRKPDQDRAPQPDPRSRAFLRGACVCFPAIAILLILTTLSLHAQAASPTEYDVKAAYLFNFMRFVEWPSGALNEEGVLHICVLGEDPFGGALDATLAGAKIAGRNVTAVHIAEPEESRQCRILFISSSEDSRLREILLALDGAPVLTVSDVPHFVERGGMIQFTLDRGKVRFEINLAVSSSAGLVLSSDLLKLAKRVTGNHAQAGG